MKIGDIIVPKKRQPKAVKLENLPPVVLIVGTRIYHDAMSGIRFSEMYDVLVGENVQPWTVYYCERFYEVLR